MMNTPSSTTFSWKQDRFLAPLEGILGDIDLLSLDIFDTLLLRCCAEPADIHLQVGKEASRLGILSFGMTPEEFAFLRQAAEAAARRRAKDKGTEEIQVESIRAALPPGMGNCQDLMNLEWNIEKKYCWLNPFTYSLVLDCHARGKKIALLSDMYYPQSDLLALLKAIGFDTAILSALLVSCEFGISKKEGLFRHLQQQFPDISPGRMLHLGDRESADVLAPKRYGMRSAGYFVIPEEAGEMLEGETLWQRKAWLPELLSLRKLACATRPGAIPVEEFWFRTGASVLGPLLTLACEWVLECSRKGQKKGIFPLMREGRLLTAVLNRLARFRMPEMRVESVFVSREAVTHLLWKGLGEQEWRYLTERKQFRIADLFTLLGWDIPEEFASGQELCFHDLGQMAEGTEWRDRLLGYFSRPAVLSRWQETIAGARCRFRGYLGQFPGLLDHGSTLDIGYRGTIQRTIDRLLREEGVPHSLDHFLIIGKPCVYESYLQGVPLRAWLGDTDGRDPILRILTRETNLLDHMILWDPETTCGYEESPEGRIVPCLRKADYPERELLQKLALHRGVEHFVDLWLELCRQKPWLHQELSERRQELAAPMARILCFPTAEEARLLGELHLEYNDGSRFLRRIIEPQDSVRLRESDQDAFLRNIHHTVPWPEGVLAREEENYFLNRAVKAWAEDPSLPAEIRMVLQLKRDRVHSVAIYGAGDIGRQVVKACRRFGIRVSGIIDRKEELWGQYLEGVEILPLSRLVRDGCRTIAVASCAFREEIRDTIDRQSWREIPVVYYLH